MCELLIGIVPACLRSKIHTTPSPWCEKVRKAYVLCQLWVYGFTEPSPANWGCSRNEESNYLIFQQSSWTAPNPFSYAHGRSFNRLFKQRAADFLLCRATACLSQGRDQSNDNLTYWACYYLEITWRGLRTFPEHKVLVYQGLSENKRGTTTNNLQESCC